MLPCKGPRGAPKQLARSARNMVENRPFSGSTGIVSDRGGLSYDLSTERTTRGARTPGARARRISWSKHVVLRVTWCMGTG